MKNIEDINKNEFRQPTPKEKESIFKYLELKNKYTGDYLRIYKKTNLKTQDNIQDIFNSIDFNYMDLNKPISNNQRKKLSRVVDEWKQLELLKGYFEYKVIEILNKRYITNQEMLSILLWGAFVKERNQLDEYEEVLSSGVVLTGGTALMPGIAELAEDIFLKPVRLGFPQYSGQLADVVKSPRYSTAHGLLAEAKKQYLRGNVVTKQQGSTKAILQRMKEWFMGNF